MEPYISLLSELGIQIKHKLQPEESVDNICSPKSYVKSDNVTFIPVFTTDQLDEFFPEQFGWHSYQVIESSSKFALDPEQEQRIFKLQPEDNDNRPGAKFVTSYHLPKKKSTGRRVHRYSRLYRFKWTLFHLVGAKSAPDWMLPESLLKDLGDYLGPKRLHSNRVYELVHRYLKENRLQKFYLSIPYLIKAIGGPCWSARTQVATSEVIYQFEKFNNTFQLNKIALARKRFPKMIYIALRLLDSLGVTPPYKINGIRTSRKRKALDSLYSSLQPV